MTKPDVVAPGDSIAAAASGTTNAYAVMSGTSMATPFVAGAMALALDANPGLTPASAKSLLESTAEDWGPSGKDNDWGSGLIDVAKLVGEAQDGRAEATTSFPTHTRVTGSVPDNGVWSHQFSVDASGLGTPVAVTVILNGQLECVWWFGPWCLAEEWTPDQDARLLDPNGQPVLDPNGLPLESTCAADEECGVGRQETLHFVPTLAGTYTVEVYPWPEGPGTGGSFAVDISQGPLGSAPPPSPPPPPDPQLPDAPVLSATPGDGTVHLSWTVPDDGGSALTVYTIYRGTSSGSLSELASVGAGTTTHDDIAVTNGTTYYYGVSAENANGEGPRSNEVSAKPADPNPPGQPTGLVATPASGRVALDWNDNPETDLAGYNVYRATSLAGPWTKANGSLVAGSAYTDTGLTNGTTYHFRVAAVDTSGNEGPTSSDVSATPNLKGYSPGTVTITRGAAVGDPVSNLNNSDDAYYRVGSRKSGGKHWTDWYGEFTVDVAVTKLYVEFEGKYSRTVSQTVYVYNYDTGAWLKIETKSVGTTDVRSTYAVGGDPDPYISSAGKVRLRVASSAGGSFTSSGDRLRIAVEY